MGEKGAEIGGMGGAVLGGPLMKMERKKVVIGDGDLVGIGGEGSGMSEGLGRTAGVVGGSHGEEMDERAQAAHFGGEFGECAGGVGERGIVLSEGEADACEFPIEKEELALRGGVARGGFKNLEGVGRPVEFLKDEGEGSGGLDGEIALGRGGLGEREGGARVAFFKESVRFGYEGVGLVRVEMKNVVIEGDGIVPGGN